MTLARHRIARRRGPMIDSHRHIRLDPMSDSDVLPA
jgi:hypothetical protein